MDLDVVRRDAYGGWGLLVDGRLGEAYDVLSRGVAAFPDDLAFRMNRSTCALAMGRAEAALEDLVSLRSDQPHRAAGPVAERLGVVLWSIGRAAEAVAAWREALAHPDAFGGVEAPALLYFAGVRVADSALRREAVGALRRRWKPRMATVWPSAVMGFLLGRLDEEAFLHHQTFLHPTLEARRLARVHFWAGVRRLEHGDAAAYRTHLRSATERPSAEDGARLLEDEYWLALAELKGLTPDR